MLLVPLVLGGWLLSSQMNGVSSGGATPMQQIDQARQAALAARFQQAVVQLEQFHALNGTYAGATTDTGVTIARADASSYCLQGGASHLAGPGGSVASGGC